MSDQLDGVYRSQRIRLYNTVSAAVERLWARGYRDRDRLIPQVLATVHAGQARTVALVDAFMAAKVRDATGSGETKGLNPESYTVEQLRDGPAEEVYQRPFGALRSFLARDGEDGFAPGMSAAEASVTRLAQTDLQLAQTHAARDWMADDRRITHYERVLGGGEHCELCIAAARNRYRREDLAPIHERCGCSVRPGFDGPQDFLRPASEFRADSPSYTVEVQADPEIGPRILAGTWG